MCVLSAVSPTARAQPHFPFIIRLAVQLDKSNDHAFWAHVQKLYTGSPSHSLADLRMRWFNFLCPTIKQCAWAPAEDAALVQFLNASAAANQPFDWMAAAAAVSSAVPSDRQASLLPATRTPASCLMRYTFYYRTQTTPRPHSLALLAPLNLVWFSLVNRLSPSFISATLEFTSRVRRGVGASTRCV